MSLWNILDNLDLALILIWQPLNSDKGVRKKKKSRGAFEPEIPRMGAEDWAAKVEALDWTGSVNHFWDMMIWRKLNPAVIFETLLAL